EWAWTLRLVIMSFFLILTLPLASHMLARAAVKDTRLLSEKDHPSVTPYQENNPPPPFMPYKQGVLFKVRLKCG
ncbi:monovalent cation/H(+) antiporter subunit G, partial [Testudinibacter sp. TR-2022]|uniref:monovalent cation/H(+) antiporter subunit G n=1 Tax=Testudinibacter sp. TR-2022 TaxID=2585029 RepID=UPI002279182A